MAFVGEPPLFRPEAEEVHVSVTFTWDRDRGKELATAWGRYYPNVLLGGPAYDDGGGEFVPARYLKRGHVITSRGCPNRCPWCLVPKREGPLRVLPITEGWIVHDNNLLACCWSHIEAVGMMLRQQPHPASFNGGLEAVRINDRVVSWLQGLRIHEVWTAHDHPNAWRAVRRAVRRLRQAGLSLDQVRCFVLVGHDGDTPSAAEARLQETLRLGCLPFAMLYRGVHDERFAGDNGWKPLVRKWTRPAAFAGAQRERERG